MRHDQPIRMVKQLVDGACGTGRRGDRDDCAVRDRGCRSARNWAGTRPADECADAARRFVTGKLFRFNCFDGSRGDGRIYGDGSVIGTIQFRGTGPVRSVWLPAGTLRVRGEAVCAALKGMPFEPCFNLSSTNDQSFRGSVVGLGLRLLRFHPSRQRRQHRRARAFFRAAIACRRPPGGRRFRSGSVAGSALVPTAHVTHRSRADQGRAAAQREWIKSLLSCYCCSGTVIGLPLSATMNTRTLAVSVWLAFADTACSWPGAS